MNCESGWRDTTPKLAARKAVFGMRNLYLYALMGRRKLRHSHLLQIAAVTFFWLIGEALQRMLKLPVPGAIIGLFVLLTLFASQKLSPSNFKLGAQWFLAEMLLFFIPAVPVVLNHQEFLGWLGLKILAVILLGTIIVMIVTALVVDVCFHWVSRQKAQN